MTALGGRPVQAVTPPEEAAKREAVRPPAAKTPEMTVPLPNAKTVKPTPAPTVKQAPDEARGRTPTKGKEPAFGSAIADTGVRGQGFGLSTGGGAGSGSTLEITGDFCCPDYLATMITRIRAAWNQNQGAQGHEPDPIHHPARRARSPTRRSSSRAAPRRSTPRPCARSWRRARCRRCPTPIPIRR